MKRLKRNDLLQLDNKSSEKVPDPRNAKEHQSFLRKKNRKSVRQSQIVTYKPKNFKNPNIGDIKSVIIEHPKTSDELSKTVGKGEKVSSNSSLYSDTKKINSFEQKRGKNSQTRTCF